MSARPKEYTAEELKEFNGEGGRPIYVALRGKVYDLTTSKRWKKGMHMNRHAAGYDLTADIGAAPHTADLLAKFPVVGLLKPEPAVTGPAMPRFVAVMLDAFPFLKRHPHPMTVHFPLACNIFATVFTFLYLTSGVESFETTALHLLGAGLLFTLVGMATGFATWWLNYLAQPMPKVIIKIALSMLVLVFSGICFVWRLADPDVLHDVAGLKLVYVAMVFSLFPLVSTVGYFGAELTFPTHGGRE